MNSVIIQVAVQEFVQHQAPLERVQVSNHPTGPRYLRADTQDGNTTKAMDVTEMARETTQ
jgi:hypothetical protein